MLRIITWNIQWGQGIDGRVDLARMIGDARKLADFDVLCLQEVSDNFSDLKGNSGENQFAALAALLPGYNAVEGVALDVPDGAGGRRRFGNMILSRLPVRQVLRHQLPWPGVAGMNMPRMLLETSIMAPFGPVRVMTTHLEYFSAQIRELSVEAIRAAHAQAASREATPRESGTGPYLLQPGSRSAILTGDFNMRPEDPTRLRLLEPFPAEAPPFLDAWTARHGGTPHPQSFCIADKRYGEPHCADYIFVTADLAPRILDIRYDTETRLSDHQPVALTLRDE